MKKRWMLKLLWLVLVVLVVGCGGGGGGIGSTSAPGSDSAPPFVDSMYPADNATGVPLNSIIRAILDKVDPDPSTVNSQNCKITQATNSVGATVSLVTNIIDIHPTNLLLPNTTYTVTIDRVKNQNGVIMPAPRVWTFTTGSAVDITPPKIVTEFPANGAVVSVNSVISATFDETIDLLTGQPANFKVVNTITGEAVAGTLILAYDDKILAFTPSQNLVAGANYTVTVTGLRNMADNVITTPIVWSFTTGVAPDLTPPTVVSVSPSSGSVVAVGATLSVIFNEAIDPASVNSDTFKLINSSTGVAIPGAITVSDKVVNLKPNANLAYSGHYEVKMQGIKDLSGNKYSLAPNIWNFSTEALPVVTISLATANWVAYSKGGVAQATFDKAAGKVTENIAGESADVSVRWAPLDIVADKTYHVTFSCASAPQRNVEVQLKENGGLYHSYSTVSVACAGTVAIDLVPNGNNPVGRININFGAATGVYNIGAVTVTY